MKTVVLTVALALSGCSNHPMLRTALIATAVASLAVASGSSPARERRVTLQPAPCAEHPEQCR